MALSNTFDEGTINDIANLYSSGQQQNAINASRNAGNIRGINIINAYKSTYGRLPTANEIAAAGPAFDSGDSQGNAFVAQQKMAEDNSPANVYAKQQSQWAEKAKDPGIQGSISQMFQSTYGRTPTADEMTHYGTLLASGQADAYQLGQFLQALPEYQNQQDTQFRQGLDTQMQASDKKFFDTVSPSISQKYAMMGRATSPALSVAMTDLAAQLSDNRQKYLTQLSASQYGGNKAAAMSNYGDTQKNVEGSIYGNSQAQYNSLNAFTNRAQNMADYNTQNQNWMQAQSQFGPKGPSTLDYLNTAANVGSTAAKLYAAF